MTNWWAFMIKKVLIFACFVLFALPSQAETLKLLYSNPLSEQRHVADWIMEGPGKLTFESGWMQMYSPKEEMHHVFWCPETFPTNFIAEWEVQNLKTDAGLVIVFFAATGVGGQGIFDSSLQKRDGTFKQYTEGDIRSYHISYYANAAHNKDRGHANLRKNNTFTLLQKGREGVPTSSTRIHKVRLKKVAGNINMWVDERLVISHKDEDKPYLGGGKIGFRQMKWTKFQYRNFKLWSINPVAASKS